MSVAGFSERETERYLVEPFIDALGYNSRNPGEVQAQLPIQIGSTTRNCDYAIKLNGVVRMLIECKKTSVNLDSPGQLASYFSQVPTALLGIYTNGIEYRFYAERNEGRVKQMDSGPFLTLNLRNIDQAAIGRVARCSNDQLGDVDAYQQWVDDSRYLQLIQTRLRNELMVQPSDELVALTMDWAGIRETAPERIEQFKIVLKEAARNIFHPVPEGDAVISVSNVTQSSQSRGTGWLPLDKLVVHLENQSGISRGEMRRSAPRAIKFPDGQQASVSSWLQMAIETAYWLYRIGRLNLGNCDIQDALFPKRRILSAEGLHPDGKSFRNDGRLIKDTGIRIDTQRSGLHFAQNVCMLIERFGQNPSQVFLEFQ